MRKIYLIRHAMPDISLGERWCIGGQTDIPLGKLGRLQAALLPFVPELRGAEKVFCSTLIRARETALPLCPDPIAVPGLEEQRMGAWDGLPFAEIMRRFPELYAAREQNSMLLPEGAEEDEAVRLRMHAALLQCLRLSSGDIAVVSHKSAIASITGQRAKLGYTSVSVLEAEGDALTVREAGKLCKPCMDDSVCLALLIAFCVSLVVVAIFESAFDFRELVVILFFRLFVPTLIFLFGNNIVDVIQGRGGLFQRFDCRSDGFYAVFLCCVIFALLTFPAIPGICLHTPKCFIQQFDCFGIFHHTSPSSIAR